MSYSDLVKAIKLTEIKFDPQRLEAVYQFANEAHIDQIRQTGEPLIEHPLSVAQTLASWRQEQVVIEAALLHEIVEQTAYSLSDIKVRFGEEVAFLVDGVNRIGQVKLRSSTSADFVENLQKMFISMAKDIRVVLIRLADRHHNMLTLEGVPLGKQKRIAIETLEVYAPLAERLGMGQLKGDLEDLSFPYIYPEEYDWVTKLAGPHFTFAESTLQKDINLLKQTLETHHLQADIHGRDKHKYSLYKKLLRPEIGLDITKVHDLVALRVITQSKSDCYAVLGLIHSLWRPAPQIGISDFIAMPKANGYQSIHTKVYDLEGNIIEVQIRTWDMHLQAEYGPASHSFYSQAKNRGATDESLEKGLGFKIKEKIDWIKQLSLWQKNVNKAKGVSGNYHLDALSERIFVFSPKGDVFDLPKGSTPVDFAFIVHTDLGHYIQSAKVNGRLVPLDHKLATGDLVEIIKSKYPKKPNRDWLRFVMSPRVKHDINKLLREA